MNESARPIKCNKFNIAAYLLKARNVESEEQLLLANSSETTFVSWQLSQTNRFPRQQDSTRLPQLLSFHGYIMYQFVRTSDVKNKVSPDVFWLCSSDKTPIDVTCCEKYKMLWRSKILKLGTCKLKILWCITTATQRLGKHVPEVTLSTTE
jgi:hypothetical protein